MRQILPWKTADKVWVPGAYWDLIINQTNGNWVSFEIKDWV